ncbi:MAG TPA: hypothetical protein VFJ14_17910 [Nocardioidaceae bacterium]|nr:hypothetical protein [Nocardioidaceae bacterium]
MANGRWSLQVVDDAPVSITDRLRDPFSLLKVFAGRWPVPQISGVTPLYTGLWLRSSDRTSCEGAGPCILLGGAGTPSNAAYYVSQGSAWGPYFAVPATATLDGWVSNIVGKNGIRKGTVGAVSGTHAIYANPTTARDWLDNWIVPQFGVEYRVTPALKLDVGTIAQLYGTTAKAVVNVPGDSGPDPGSLPGLTASRLDAELDYTDWRNRVLNDWSDGTNVGRYDTGIPSGASAPFALPGGDVLEWAECHDGAPSSSAAQTGAGWLLAAHLQPSRQIDVEVNDPDLGGIAPTLVGAYLDVYDPRRNLYDLSNPVTHRGRLIYPAKVRCMGATWPIRQGMGVYLDDTGNGGVITDITDYVAWEEPSLTLTVGSLPVGLDGRRRTVSA